MSFKIGDRLPQGAKLKTLTGDLVEVISLISAKGGQGDVYKAAWKGKNYALKWYNREQTDVVGSAQYQNIYKLTQKSNPDPARFVWPMVVVTETGREETNALFGYLMELLPEGYFELKEYLRSDDDAEKARFKSFHAMIWAGMHLTTAMRNLHLQGMSYKDLNPGNVSIHPATGRVMMVDCDNISVDGDPCTVAGMRGYMAPEIVRTKFAKTPDITTDQFSLAILLFRMFYMDHPFEGSMWAKFPIHDDSVEDELYSIHPVYNMAAKDTSNRPNKDWAPNVVARMKKLPIVLLQGFEKTFVQGIDHPTGRTTEHEWMALLTAARDQFVFLDNQCQREQLVRFENRQSIPPRCLRMTFFGRNNSLALYPFQSLFANTVTGAERDYEKRIGYVAAANGKLYIQNMSGTPWRVIVQQGAPVATVPDQKWVELRAGMQICFDTAGRQVAKVDDPIK